MSLFTSEDGDPSTNPGTDLPPSFFQFSNKEHETYGHTDRTVSESYGFSTVVLYDWERLSLRSQTAANWIDANASTDLFASQVAFAGFEGVTNSKDFNQELQLTELDGIGVDWMLGVSYFEEQSNAYEDLVGIQGGVPSLTSRVDWSVEATSIFGEVYYTLSDAIGLTVGVRYTEETFEATPIVDAIAPVGVGKTKDVNDNALTYRVVLDHTSEWGMVYGSIATGFKSGGISTANVSSGAYDAEELTAYELGIKSTVADGRVRLNAAAFIYDFSNIQAQVVGGPSGGASFFVAGDEADLKGVEFELQTQLSRSLSVQAGATLLIVREYTDYDVPGQGSPGSIDYIPGVFATGNDMVGVAELSVLIGAQYRMDMADKGTLVYRANVNYSSGYYHTVGNEIGTSGLSDDGFTRANARLTYITPQEDWEVALWVNNVTDENYTRSGLVAFEGGSKLGLESPPRHFGVSAKYSF